jgi:hypothetical protein
MRVGGTCAHKRESKKQEAMVSGRRTTRSNEKRAVGRHVLESNANNGRQQPMQDDTPWFYLGHFVLLTVGVDDDVRG